MLEKKNFTFCYDVLQSPTICYDLSGPIAHDGTRMGHEGIRADASTYE